MDPFPFEVQRQTGVARAVLAQRGTVPTSFPVGHWLFFPPPYGAIPRNVFPTERYDERPGVAGQRRRWVQATFAELYAALRAKALANGYTNEYELGGFVRH